MKRRFKRVFKPALKTTAKLALAVPAAPAAFVAPSAMKKSGLFSSHNIRVMKTGTLVAAGVAGGFAAAPLVGGTFASAGGATSAGGGALGSIFKSRVAALGEKAAAQATHGLSLTQARALRSPAALPQGPEEARSGGWLDSLFDWVANLISKI